MSEISRPDSDSISAGAIKAGTAVHLCGARKGLAVLFLALFLQVSNVFGFVMIGVVSTNEFGSSGVDFNYTDDLGGPKEEKRFFRWNIPHMCYAFDSSFINFFGLEGRQAVGEAINVINDFFENSAYTGVSSLDLTSHGFRSNYNTTWVNTTAQNQKVMDVKSLVLGMMVNHIGLGNPHRYSFGIRSMTTNAAGTQINFNVRLRNYDPMSYKPTAEVNNVTYSYRLIHDAPASVGVTVLPTFADMEEFTTDTSGNAFTAVAGIIDAFYGNTAIYWTRPPTLFDFGIYYDGLNATGGKTDPRHALTYDDAGGLKYLYRTNNFVYETLDPSVVLIVPAQFLPMTAMPVFPGPTGRLYPDSLGGNQGFIPRRNSGLTPGLPTVSVLPAQAPPALVDVALRGGIDKIKFTEQPFDSLIGITFTATNITWTDTFVATNGQTVIGLNETRPSGTLTLGVPTMKFFTQQVGRGLFQPDIIFVADELGVSPDGVPLGFNRTDNSLWIDNYTNNLGPVNLNTVEVGPGIISGPMQFTFGKLLEGFEVIWSGEAGLVGNTNTYSLWGHIQGPGADQFLVFPRDTRQAIIENAIAPATTAPSISRIYDSGDDARLTRTQEKLIIEGQRLASVDIIQIMNGDLELQTIYPATKYIVSDQLIEVPPGILTDAAEGALSSRTVRVWNSVGPSPRSANSIGISTGPPVLVFTERDDLTFDRRNTLAVRGYGFKSKALFVEDGSTSLTHFRVDNAAGGLLQPAAADPVAATFEIRSDIEAVLPAAAFTTLTDGSNRRLRLGRTNSALYLSATNRVRYIASVTSKPIIAGVTLDGSGNLRRDAQVDINGTALNTAYRIELVKSDGTSLSPSVEVILPDPGVSVEDNGSKISISANVIFNAGADGFGTSELRKVKVYNLVDNGINATNFNVNAQPQLAFIGPFANVNAFNRHNLTGDDVSIIGVGLMAVSELQIINDDGTAIGGVPNIILKDTTNGITAGVTITDSKITIDTQTIQFANGANADSTHAGAGVPTYRRFKLISQRDAALTSQNQRFVVATPPTFTSLGAFSPVNQYERDVDTMTINGTGFGWVTKVEIVDANGNPVVGVNGIDATTGVTFVSSTQLTVAANKFTQGNLLDSVTALSRRVKVTTPVGSVTSTAGAAGAFTLSATPTFMSTAAQTFAGGGFDGGTSTYTSSTGALVINGSNFRGVKQIRFLTGVIVDGTTAVDPAAPPAGYTFSADGRSITITAAVLPAGFLLSGSGKTVDLSNATTPVASQSITVQ